MSKIRYLDFAKYVSNQKTALASILSSKGQTASNDDSLDSLVAKAQNIPYEEPEQYQPDSYFQSLIDSYKLDEELVENGGEYIENSYLVIDNRYAQSCLYMYATSSYPVLIKYSDGTSDLITSTRTITHVWADNEPLEELEDGTKVRTIKIYFKEHSSNQETYAIQGCPPIDNPTNYTDFVMPLVFVLCNTQKAFGNNGTVIAMQYMYRIKNAYNLRYIHFGEKFMGTLSSGSGSSGWIINNCPKLECITCEGVFSGSWWSYGNFIANCFGIKYLQLNLESCSISQFANKLPLLKSINLDIFDNKTAVSQISISNKLFSEIVFNFPNATTQSSQYIYSYEHSLKTYIIPNITYSNSSPIYPYALYTPLLETLIVPEDFDHSLHLGNAPLLTQESIEGIITNLKDLSGLTAKTITFNYNAKDKISNEQLQTLQNKNWTVSFVE